MLYVVIIPEEIQKKLDKKLNNELLQRFYKKMKKLELSPGAYGKPLRVPLAGIWEIYFEKRWRVLFEIKEKQKIVLLTAFKHKYEM